MILTLNPIKECKVSSIVQTDIHRLTKINAIKQEPLYWCNGLLFSMTEFESEEVITKQTQEGIYYLDDILYCKSPVIDESKWDGYTIEVIDCSGHSFYEELTKGILGLE